MTKNVLKGLILAGLVAGAAGCATVNPDQLSEVRAMAQEAQRTAEAAQASADQANTAAADARRAAESAVADAKREARACCEANSKRIERMFEESQKK